MRWSIRTRPCSTRPGTRLLACASRSRSTLAGIALSCAVLTGCQTPATLPAPTQPTTPPSSAETKVDHGCATYEKLHLAVTVAERLVIDRKLSERQQTILRNARQVLDAACQGDGVALRLRIGKALLELGTILEN